MSVDSKNCVVARNRSDNFWLTSMMSPMVQNVLVVISKKYVAAVGAGRVNRTIPVPPHQDSTAKTNSHTALKRNIYFRNLAGNVCLQLQWATVTADASEIMAHDKEMKVRRKNMLPSINTK